MCNWKGWLVPGAVTVAVLTGVSAWFFSAPLENRLLRDAAAALAERHPWAIADLSGRDLSLSGRAPTPEAAGEALALAAAIPGVRIVADGTTLLPLAEPYRLAATWKDGSLRIEGSVPDEATRESLRAAASAALPEARTEFSVELARGAPDGFAALASHALAQFAGLTQGRIDLTGSELSVTGVAVSPQTYEQVTTALATGLPAGRLVSLDIPPPVASPYRWSLTRQGSSLLIEGFAPSAADRDAFAAAAGAALPDLAIDNRLLVASGVGEGVDWRAASDFMLAQFGRLADGSVRVADGAMTFDGRAADPQAYRDLGSALGSDLPAGLTLAAATVRQPLIDPYLWSLSPGEGGAVVLSGFAPDRQTAARLVEAVRSRSGPPARIDDRQETAAGAPSGFEQAVTAVIGPALRLDGVRIEVEGTTVTVGGNALTGTAANEVRDAIASAMPPSFVSAVNIELAPVGPFVEPGECQSRLDAALASDTIRFETGSAAIAPASFGLLDRLAFAMRHCPQARIEVGGHTDSEGPDDANLALSQARAQSVVDFLVRAGVFQSRLAAKGFGESQPVAENATPEGRARNRRIEFAVKP